MADEPTQNPDSIYAPGWYEYALGSIGTYWRQITKPSFRINYLSFNQSPFERYGENEWESGMYNVAEVIVKYSLSTTEYSNTDVKEGKRELSFSEYKDEDRPVWNTSTLWKHGDGTTDTWSDLSNAENTMDEKQALYMCGLAVYVKGIGWDAWYISSRQPPFGEQFFVLADRAVASAEEAATKITTLWYQEKHNEEMLVHQAYRRMVDQDLTSGKKISWRPDLFNTVEKLN